MVESRCGISCSECGFKEQMGCAGCMNIEKPFWAEESCPLKACCEDKEHEFCGECKTFPCKLLHDFSYDKEQGDDGKRIATAKIWKVNDISKKIFTHSNRKKGAREDYSPEWGATRFFIRDKMFLMVGDNKEERPIVTLKLRPENSDFLRREYPEAVIAGYYMNKIHWSSVFLEMPFDTAKLLSMVDEAYELVLCGFSKKVQAEILEESK